MQAYKECVEGNKLSLLSALTVGAIILYLTEAEENEMAGCSLGKTA